MRLLAILVASLGLSACALTVDSIDVPYQAGANLSVVEGASDAKVQVSGIEGRTVYKDRVSVKKNGYGMEMADIVASNDIPKTIASAVEKELSSLGYAIGPGGSKVEVQVTRFYNDFKIGMFSGDAIADASAIVKVIGPDGKNAFIKHYEAGGIEENIQLTMGSNARQALIKAMRNLVAAIINDKDLQTAIIVAQAAK
ncbi:YajG family lipoprotein [Magnetospirillum fulvum]|uniref:Uncharacterized lipoprotein n=1 Tax=Magnetospirillum fulvum TaxID=1082 RepID=A0A1H6GR99_MAGFU|nr:YajG family lipoprotein [Magnetospirillum fulvum]SEH25806.1 uncharacterized lipoprotein [Magnetospirillum fulvum]